MTLVHFDELVADDFVQLPSIWRNGGETVVHADHVNPFHGSGECNKLQVGGVSRVDETSSYCVRSFFLVDSRLVADHEFYASPPAVYEN